MTETGPEGLRLTAPGVHAPIADYAVAKDCLRQYGIGLWRHDLSDLSPALLAILDKERPSAAELEELKTAMLFERETLRAYIRDSGRAEAVDGGGALETRVVNHGYDYPQLFLVEAGIDYSRFDTYHVNTADDGTAVDEVIQILCGAGVRVFHRVAGGEVSLRLDAPSAQRGWILSYSGGQPHIGSFAEAEVGTKALVQVIGPPLWTMRYEMPGDLN